MPKDRVNDFSPHLSQPEDLVLRGSTGGERVVRTSLITAGTLAASLIALVTGLVAAGAKDAAIVAVYAIIALIVGALAVAGIYVWKNN